MDFMDTFDMFAEMTLYPELDADVEYEYEPDAADIYDAECGE